MRVPYYIIKKMGRWVSDAALCYYRDDEDVIVSVTEAFEGCYELIGGIFGVVPYILS